jgi:NADPH:quinone reductase-like Zn-dependent oxidoreductase
MPANLTFEQAASVPVAAATVVQALPGKGRSQPGHKVLVNDASGEAGDVRGADRQGVRRREERERA